MIEFALQLNNLKLGTLNSDMHASRVPIPGEFMESEDGTMYVVFQVMWNIDSGTAIVKARQV